MASSSQIVGSASEMRQHIMPTQAQTNFPICHVELRKLHIQQNRFIFFMFTTARFQPIRLFVRKESFLKYRVIYVVHPIF